MSKIYNRVVDLASPAPSWVHRLSKGGNRSMAELRVMWGELSIKQRRSRWLNEVMKENLLAKSRKAVEKGKANARTRNLVTKGGNVCHGKDNDARLMYEVERHKRKCHLTSQDTLDFRLRAARGCCEHGCPLGPPKDGENAVPLSLLEHDHVDPATKTTLVTWLTGAAREDELKKTVCRCLWHHFVRTREQLNHRSVEERALTQRVENTKVAEWKEYTHCQHPHHSQMPYASLVPSAHEDPLMVGFLNVSPLHLQPVPFRERSTGEKRLELLETGTALVFCKFCRALYRQCERSKLAATPFALHQMPLLKRVSPEFVDHFEKATAGFDWAAEHRRLSDRMVKGNNKRYGKEDGKKEEEDSEEDSDE